MNNTKLLIAKAMEESGYSPFDRESPTGFARPKEFSSTELLAYFAVMIDEGQVDLATNEMTELLTLGKEFCELRFPAYAVRNREDTQKLFRELHAKYPGLIT